MYLALCARPQISDNICCNHTLRERGVMILSVLVDEGARKFSPSSARTYHTQLRRR
jgi:hypothetical protein